MVPINVKGYFDIQENAAVDMLLFKFRVTWSASLIIPWSVVLWRAWKPH